MSDPYLPYGEILEVIHIKIAYDPRVSLDLKQGHLSRFKVTGGKSELYT